MILLGHNNSMFRVTEYFLQAIKFYIIFMPELNLCPSTPIQIISIISVVIPFLTFNCHV